MRVGCGVGGCRCGCGASFILYLYRHYSDVIMSTMASQITSLTIVYSVVYSGADQRKHQSSASLAFVRGIHRWPVISPHKGPVTRKMSPFDNVIMFILISRNMLILSLFFDDVIMFILISRNMLILSLSIDVVLTLSNGTNVSFTWAFNRITDTFYMIETICQRNEFICMKRYENPIFETLTSSNTHKHIAQVCGYLWDIRIRWWFENEP